MMKNLSRRVFSVLLALALVTTAFVMPKSALNPTAEAAVTVADSVIEDLVMFSVPEAVYLAPVYDSYYAAQEMQFQWFVNNTMSSTGALTPKTGEEKTGSLYFYYKNTTSVAISFDFVDANGTVVQGGAITYGDSVSRTAGLAYTMKPSTTAINITKGTSPSIAASTTGVWIRWKATYVDSTDARTKTATAYTYVYKPYVQPVGVTLKTVNDRGSNHYGSNWSWVSGVHDTVDVGGYYPRVELNGHGALTFSSSNSSQGVKIGDLYAQFANSNAASSRFKYTASNDGSQNWVTTSLSPAYVPDKSFNHQTNSLTGHSTGDDAFHNVMYSPTALLTVDTSRYTNINQIPNVSVGLMVTDDEASSGNGAWFINNITSTSFTPLEKGNIDYFKSQSTAQGLWNTYRMSTPDIAYAGNYNATVSGAESEGVKFNGRWGKTLTNADASKTYYVGTGYYNHDSGDTIWNIAELRIKVNTYNKTALRSAVKGAINSSASLDEAFYDTTATAYINYVNLFRAASMALTKIDGAFSVTAMVDGSSKTYTSISTLANDLNTAKNNLLRGSARLSKTATQTNIAILQQDNGSYRCVQMVGANQKNTQTFKTFQKVTMTAENKAGYSFLGVVKTTSVPNVSYNTTVSYPTFTTSAEGATINGGTVTYTHADVNGTDGYGNIYYSYYYLVNNYTVRYDSNTGSGTMADQTFYYNVEQSLATNTFTKRGYTFAGWSTTKGGAKAYDDGQIVSTLSGTNGAVVTLYAVWKSDAYSITYSPAGGVITSTGYPTTYTIEDSITLPTCTRAGYTFSGWRADNGGNWGPLTYTAGSPISAGKYGDVVMTGTWKANTYYVSYNSNGGTGTMDQQSFTYDEDKTLTPNAFSKPGCTFQGWATSGNTTNVTYSNTELVRNLTTQDKGTVTLYAVWSTNNYSIVYNVNGGSIKDAANSYTRSYTLDDVVVLPTNVTKTGYEFQGWVPASATGNWQMVAYTGTQNQGMYGSITMVAQWQASTYTIKYNADGGVISGTSYTTSYTYDTAVTLPKATKAGYVFIGWESSDAGNWGANVYNSGSLGKGMYGNVDMTAQWRGNTYYILFNGNNSTSGMMVKQTMTYGVETALNENAYVRTGYKFLGWATSSMASSAAYQNGQTVSNLTTTANADFQLYAVWQKENYTITYDTNGGSITETGYTTSYDVSDRVVLPTAIKTGYTFTCWRATTDVGGWTKSVDYAAGTQNAGLTGSVTLSAQWTKVTYKITYNADGGTLSGSYTTNYDIDTAIVLATATRPGYTFSGWQADAGWSNLLITTGKAPTGMLANVTLTAKWTQEMYTIRFNANEGTGTMADVKVGYEVNTTLPGNTFTRQGYDFLGWSKTRDGAVEYADKAQVINLADTATKTVTLYAVWQIKSFSLNYNLNGAAGTMIASTVTLGGAAITLRANNKTEATINGKPCSFVGWAYTKADADAGVVAYENKASFSLTDEVLAQMEIDWSGARPAITLYAVWTIKSFDVIYDLNGAEGTVAPANVTLGGDDILLSDVPSYNVVIDGAHYTFAGWAYKSDTAYDAAEYSAGVAFGLTEEMLDMMDVSWEGTPSVKLYAVWMPVSYAAADDSTTQIDEANGIIYGINPGATVNDIINNYMTTSDNAYVKVITDAYVGTGTTVQVFAKSEDGKNDIMIAEYTVLIYGDMNGDGIINNTDQVMIRSGISGAVDLEGEPLLKMAADLNGDGIVNSTDVVYARSVIAGSGVLNQVTRELD